MLSLEPFKNRRPQRPLRGSEPTCAIPAHSGQVRHFQGLVWPVFCLGAFSALLAYAWPFCVDDAFILARYARRLAHGQGYTFRDGPPTDGVTGPLWFLFLWVGARLGLHPLTLGKLLGGVFAAWSVARVLGRVGGRSLGRLVSPLTSAVCLTSVPLVIWPVAGLETGLATWLVTEIALAVTRAGGPRVVTAGIASGLCAWLRPELAFFVVAMLVALSLRAGKRAWMAWALACAGACSVLVFRRVMFGHWMPMSAAAKPADFASGWNYLARAVGTPEAVIVFVAVALGRRALRSTQRVVWSALVMHGLAVILAGGDWMPGFRLLCPMVPLFAWMVADALADLWWRRKRAFWSCLALMLTLRVHGVSQELRRAREAGTTLEQAWPRMRALFAHQRGPVAAVDVGWLGEVYPGPIIDLGGLTEPDVAYAAGGHVAKRVPSPWLEGHEITTFVLHSAVPPRVDALGRLRWFQGFPVERRVLSMPWVMRDYRVSEVFSYQPAYHYVLLTRQGAGP